MGSGFTLNFLKGPLSKKVSVPSMQFPGADSNLSRAVVDFHLSNTSFTLITCRPKVQR